MNLDKRLDAAAREVRTAARAVAKKEMTRMTSRVRNQRILVAASAVAVVALVIGAVAWLLPGADLPDPADTPPVTTVAPSPETTTAATEDTVVDDTVADTEPDAPAPPLAEDAVVIETVADYSDRPVVGTFEVTVGADLLGCASGTFEDEYLAPDDIRKIMTCDVGDRAGVFTLTFAPGEDEDRAGPWSVVEGSGDFAGLFGDGDFTVVFPDDDTGEETLIGTFRVLAEDAVVIETVADYSDRPVVGTFEVTVGADLLGCAS
ncbi:MAG: hypothetical protein HKN46_04610, partial [Acidimicrobiia bacterium]|nr:hypothetical protein [Acidimicrobiia bacterium]